MSEIGLYIAGSGLTAQQEAMDSVAQNLANSNTPGYIQEQAQLVTSEAPAPFAAGAGVRVADISQVSNAIYQASDLAGRAASSGAQALSQTLSALQSFFPEPSSSGFAAQLSSFWSSWDTVSQNPSTLAPRTVVVAQAGQLVTELNQMSNDLAQTASDTRSSLSNLASQATLQLSQVAALNASITAGRSAGQDVSSLVDQRNALVEDLASSLGVTVRYQPSGSADLYIGGANLVQGAGSNGIQVQTDPATGKTSLVLDAGGIALDVTSGSASGLLNGLNGQIPAVVHQLNVVAEDLASSVNGQLAGGYTTSGTSGAAFPMFQSSSGGPISAATIEVNPALVANPMDIAASSSPVLGNDGSNAQAIAELYNSSSGPDQAYRSLIGDLGSATQAAQEQSKVASALSNSAIELNQSVSGVNTNSQEISLVGYQQAFQALGNVVSTINTAMQSLLAAT